MAGMIDWAADVLMSRGALVERDDAGALRALLSPELAEPLGASEWLSLRFGAGLGSDDEGDWLERLSRLLPAEPRVIRARLRRAVAAPPIDAEAALDAELVIQNGVFRLVEHHQATARHYFLTFQYAIQSDETSLGVCTACLNPAANSLAPQPESLLHAIRDDLEDDPASSAPPGDLPRLLSMALRGVQPEILRRAAGFEDSANRRLARDAARIDAYYRGLLRQIEKRAARRAADPEAAEKERSRAAATELDRAAKLEDLARKYALKIRIEAGDVLATALPVREISVRLRRKKLDRLVNLHWLPALGVLETPWCENCFGAARPLFLCDDRLHCLCRQCFAPCPECGRQFCRACKSHCACGAGRTML